MEQSNRFELEAEITEFLKEVDHQGVVGHGGKEELFDHFMTEVEELEDNGLSPKEAFEVSKLRFGGAALIRKEYEKVNPFLSVGQKLLIGLISFFAIMILVSAINISSAFTLWIAYISDIPWNYITLFDLFLKAGFVAGFVGIFFYQIKNQKGNIPQLAWLVPVISLFMGAGSELLWSYATRWNNGVMIAKVFQNATLIYIVFFVSLMFLSYFLLIRERKKTEEFVPGNL